MPMLKYEIKYEASKYLMSAEGKYPLSSQLHELLTVPPARTKL